MDHRIEVLLKSEIGDPGPGKGTIDGKELEAVVDADLESFEAFFCKKLNNPALADAEKAVIKTYLWYKLHPEV